MMVLELRGRGIGESVAIIEALELLGLVGDGLNGML